MPGAYAKPRKSKVKTRPVVVGEDARIRILRCPPETEAALFIGSHPVQHVFEEEGVCTLDPLYFGTRTKPVRRIPKDGYTVQILTCMGGKHITITGVMPGYRHTIKRRDWLRYWWRRYVLRVDPLAEA